MRLFRNPVSQRGHIQILKGNLAPEGAVAKITGKEGLSSRGPAKVFDSEEDMLPALERKEIGKGDVIVIRYEGPKGGPGMPEMLTPTSAVMGAGLGKDVALITDGRFSGGSHGFIVGHITPEAQEGGPMPDPQRRPHHHRRRRLSDLRGRRCQRAGRATRDVSAPGAQGHQRSAGQVCVRLVKSAADGCVTD